MSNTEPQAVPQEKFEEKFKTKTMFLDKRPIIRAEECFKDEEDHHTYTVGRNGVAQIELYGEPGQFSMIPWIAVYEEGNPEPRVRAPAHAFLLDYGRKE